MAILTTHAAQILNKEFGGTNYTAETTWYVALRAAGTELTGGSYARVAVTNNTTNWAAVAANIKTNSTIITFPQATTDWASADEVALFIASSGGTAKYSGFLDTVVRVLAGQTRSFAVGDFRVKFL